jgi:GntP family gluconate:H+ symporter
MMLGGLVIGIFTVSFGYVYAIWANKRWTIPLRETMDMSLSELESIAVKDDKELPALWMSLAPIVLPVFLIAGNTVLQVTLGQTPVEQLSAWQQHVMHFFVTFGNSNIALTVAAGLALIMLFQQLRAERSKLGQAVQSALSSAGVIILITAAGGAFGGTLQQAGIGLRIEELSSGYQVALLPLAFFITALVRTAQGSATVAMITAVGILAGIADQGQLGFHPVYLALVIGCGSKPFQWMNDSGFWIISRMSGMTEAETLKSTSVMLLGMGLFGLIITIIFATLFPLV